MNSYTIYTDGACSGNPGPGGWGVLITSKIDPAKKLSGAMEQTTNNRMELQAAIEALAYIKEKSNITLVTDSTYVKNGITQWIHNWKKNNWITSNKKPVKNVDLWEKLDLLVQFHIVKWEWVKGHSNHYENDIADELARMAIEEL